MLKIRREIFALTRILLTLQEKINITFILILAQNKHEIKINPYGVSVFNVIRLYSETISNQI